MILKKNEAPLLNLGSIFARLNYKINFDLTNTSSTVLATDILRDNIKRKLFKIVTKNIETVFFKRTRFTKDVPLFTDKVLFFKLIKTSTEEFLTSFYGRNIVIRPELVKDSFYTKSLLDETNVVFTAPLDALSNSESHTFRSLFVPIYDRAYDSFVEALLDNLVIEVCTSVTYLILHEFSFIYDIRKSFYRSNFLSLRNVERFKNNLSWQTRLKAFIKRPSYLYNSQYAIWVIRTTGLYFRIVYANRSEELSHLRRLPLLTLVSIEAKDFLVSRFDELFYLFGSTARYTLTSVIGQVIGLIWRGVIEGLKK